MGFSHATGTAWFYLLRMWDLWDSIYLDSVNFSVGNLFVMGEEEKEIPQVSEFLSLEQCHVREFLFSYQLSLDFVKVHGIFEIMFIRNALLLILKICLIRKKRKRKFLKFRIFISRPTSILLDFVKVSRTFEKLFIRIALLLVLEICLLWEKRKMKFLK